MAKTRIMTAEEAVKQIKDGDTIVIATFFSVGAPLTLIHALARQGTKNLHIISNDPGLPSESTGILIRNGQVAFLTVSYIATNPDAEKLIAEGKLNVTLIPQGTLIEKLRATGFGIGGFYTPTGVGTEIAEGKEVRVINGREYILEEAFPKPKFGFFHARVADKKGNLRFFAAANNFNQASISAPEISIVEAGAIIPTGRLEPDKVDSSSAFTDILVQRTVPKIRPWELKNKPVGKNDEKRLRIAKRIAQELKDGDVVNLGIGIPTLIPQYVPSNVRIDIQSENGILGVGPRPPEGEEDPDIIDAGGNPVTTRPGASFFDSATAFGMIRGGHVDVTVLGALQVDAKGNLANYMIPGKRMPGIGGGMDLAANAKKVIIATEHTGPKGIHKIVKKCNLPLTARGVVSLIVTELAVIEVGPKGLILKEMAPDCSLDEIRGLTGADLEIGEDLKMMKI
ncbi:MAG: 3-oxoacid CoA-transferase subunit B [Patescibacteria group bacterium]